MRIRDALAEDLPAIVDIYNATIPGRMATADLEPVTVQQRGAWFITHTPDRRPLWVAEDDGAVLGWLSLRDFYGRPAYAATAEVGVYVGAAARRRGVAATLLAWALERAPALGISTLIAVVFAHNDPSIALFLGAGFERWGLLPRVAQLDGRRVDVVLLGREVGPAATRG